MKNLDRKKLIVIGIDGGTFDLINPLIKKNLLPNLSSLKNKTILKSTLPPGTAVSWASFLTGKHPGKTGIFDFTLVGDDSWKISFVNRKKIRSKQLWEFLNEANLRSIFLNIPLTYPAAKINGVMISGIDAPSKFSNYVSPERLKKKLNELDYEIEVSGIKEEKSLPQEAMEILEKRIEAANYLLKKDFDFFTVLFRATDVVQHFAWGEKIVGESYEKIDSFIGGIKKKFGETANIIVMSDHGHENLEKAFNVNSWLEKEGYLKIFGNNKKGILNNLGITRERIFHILDKFGLKILVKIVPRKLGKKIPTKNIDFEEAILTKKIDLTNTKAIAKRAVKTSQIFINSKKRGGIVNENEVTLLNKEIKKKLENYFLKQKVKATIKLKEELYGESSMNAPDITLYMDEKNCDTLSTLTPSKKIWDSPKEKATHNTEGILLTNLQLNLSSPKVEDLAPTILDYFDIKEKNFDGKSLLK